MISLVLALLAPPNVEAQSAKRFTVAVCIQLWKYISSAAHMQTFSVLYSWEIISVLKTRKLSSSSYQIELDASINIKQFSGEREIKAQFSHLFVQAGYQFVFQASFQEIWQAQVFTRLSQVVEQIGTELSVILYCLCVFSQAQFQ